MLNWLNRNAEKEQILGEVSLLVSGQPSVEPCLSPLCAASSCQVVDMLSLTGLVHCLRCGISLI